MAMVNTKQMYTSRVVALVKAPMTPAPSVAMAGEATTGIVAGYPKVSIQERNDWQSTDTFNACEACQPVGCDVEPGFVCNGEPSECNSICGDGIQVGDESCDDGNEENGDGCDKDCRVEEGFWSEEGTLYACPGMAVASNEGGLGQAMPINGIDDDLDGTFDEYGERGTRIWRYNGDLTQGALAKPSAACNNDLTRLGPSAAPDTVNTHLLAFTAASAGQYDIRVQSNIVTLVDA